jgi:hypothetical protein
MAAVSRYLTSVTNERSPMARTLSPMAMLQMIYDHTNDETHSTLDLQRLRSVYR